MDDLTGSISSRQARTSIPLKYAIGLFTAHEVRHEDVVLVHAGSLVKESLVKGLPEAAREQTITVEDQENLQAIVNRNMFNEDRREIKKLHREALEFEDNSYLFREGEESFEVYVLTEGTVEVLKQGKVIATISQRGTFIGEMAVLRNRHRSADVRTVGRAKLLCFNGRQLIESAKKNPLVLARLCLSLARKLSSADKRIASKVGRTVTSGFFSDYFDSHVKLAMKNHITFPQGEVSLKKRDILFKQNDRSTDMFLLLEGEVGVYIHDVQIATISQKGQVIGEMSGLLCRPRTATIMALTDVTLFCIPSGKLKTFTSNHPEIIHQICLDLAERVAATTDEYLSLTDNDKV